MIYVLFSLSHWVQGCVKRLNPKKACGPDKMPILVLKETVNEIEIAPVLQNLFQQSLDSGEVPSDWKNANIEFESSVKSPDQ